MNLPEDSFLSHLVELRDRLIRALLAIGIVFICLFPWAKELYALLAQPLLATLPQGGQMIATDVIGVFLVPMKVALMVAFLIALPYVLYQVWAFVAPGLYAHEKRLALPLVAASVLCSSSAWPSPIFSSFPTVFGFMANRGARRRRLDDRHREVPVLRDDHLHRLRRDLRGAGGGARSGPGRHRRSRQAREWRPYVIVGAFVVAAVFTPPDVISQLMMAIPCACFSSLGCCSRVLSASAAAAGEADDAVRTAAAAPSGHACPAAGNG
jgi:sec-independent protein translocase protein TatC